MIYRPRDYQRAMIDFALKHPRCNLYAGVGVGKTSVTLAVIDTLLLCGYVNRVLILAPKRVAVSTWPAEIQQWSSFRHLRYALAVGGKAQRAAAVASGAEIVIVNYDVLDAMVTEFGEHWPFDMVVSDELTKLKSLRVSVRKSKTGKEFIVGQGGKRSRMLAKVAHSKIKRWLGLTGSPAPNGVQDVWATTWFVDAGQRLGRSFSAFTDRWFRQIPKGDRIEIEPRPGAQEEIQGRIKDCCMTVEAVDYFDLPPLVETTMLLEMPPKAMALYKEFEREMFMELDGVEIEAFNAAAMTMKCRQFAAGALYTENGQWEEVHDIKIEALRDVIEESNGASILVAYQFKSDAARILKAFPKAKQIDDDPQTIIDFNAGRIPLLLGHPASMGHGLSMQHSCWTLVDFNTGFNLEEDEQVLGRICPTRQAQSGYNRTVYRIRLVAKGTIEEYVVKRVKSKDSIQQMLREAMKTP